MVHGYWLRLCTVVIADVHSTEAVSLSWPLGKIEHRDLHYGSLGGSGRGQPAVSVHEQTALALSLQCYHNPAYIKRLTGINC